MTLPQVVPGVPGPATAAREADNPARLLELANQRISLMWNRLAGPCQVGRDASLRVGVDLGTANVVVAVLDERGEPLAAALESARVVRDGLVVDYLGAVRIIRRLVADLEERLDRKLARAACAIPPGTGAGAERVTANVVEAAGLEVTGVLDEPTAAAALLEIKDGAVVDVGGGTTGISVLRGGRVIYTADEPTGGTHFTLVLAGHLNVSFEEAEAIKLGGRASREIAPVLHPVVEKVASIVQRHLTAHPARTVYLVGGAVALPGMAAVIASYLGVPVYTPAHPLLVTPMGIALLSAPQGG